MMKAIILFVLASVLCGSVYSELSQTNYEGELDIICEDDLLYMRSESLVVSLKTSDNQNLKLNMSLVDPDFVKQLRTGDKVNITVHDKADSDDTKYLVTDIKVISNSKREVELSGERKIVLLLVDLNSNLTTPCSAADIASSTFTASQSIAGMYSEMSGGTLTWNGDVDGTPGYDIFGPFDLNLASVTTCDYINWADSVDSAATAAGVNLDLYQHKAYILPDYSELPCGWAGMGNVGCSTQCRTWTSMCASPSALAHELGHNLGLNHANKMQNGVEASYMDFSCIMGGSGFWRELNLPHKMQLGWSSSIIDLTSSSSNNHSSSSSGSSSGSSDGFSGTRTYSLSAAELVTPPYPQAVKLPSSYSGRFYVISYRAPSGEYDTPSNSNMQPYYGELSIHTHDGTGTTILMGTIGAGETYTDSALNIHIKLLSTSGFVAQVQINGNITSSMTSTDSTSSGKGSSGSSSSGSSSSSSSSTTSSTGSSSGKSRDLPSFQLNEERYSATDSCKRAPIITASPSSLIGQSGHSYNTILSIQNVNSAICSPVAYSVASSAPLGWTVTSPLSIITMAPQTTNQALIIVKPNFLLEVTNHIVTITVSDFHNGIYGEIQIPFESSS